MSKLLAKIILIFVLCISVFTGCALTETNMARYLNQTVAKTSNGYTVTMEELITGFNTYGESYFNNGYSAADTFKAVINDIINKKVVLDYIDENYPVPVKYEWRAMQAVFDFVNSEIASLEEEVRKDWEILLIGGESPEDTTATNSTYIYSKFESTFVFEDGVLSFADHAEEHANESFPFEKPKTISKVSDFEFTSIGAQQTASEENKKVFQEAKTRYFNNLKKASESRGISGKNNDELLVAEIDRAYKIQLENEKLNYLSHNIWEDTMQTSSDRLSRLKTEIFNTYQNLVATERKKYETSNQTILEQQRNNYLSTISDSQQNSDPIYYHPISDAFFYVSHILLKFDDETQAKLDEMQEGISTGKYTKKQYDDALEEAYSKLRVAPRSSETGMVEEGTSGKLAQTILEEIVQNVKGNSAEKIEKFREYMFMYNGDDGIMGRQTAYVIPTESYKSYDQMVPEFADVSRELYNNRLGKPGDFAPKLVESPYGYHIIMYLGPVENVATEFTNIDTIINILASTRIRADYHKTYLDLVFENLAYNELDDYNVFVKGIIDLKMQNVDIKIYKNRYRKELKKFE